MSSFTALYGRSKLEKQSSVNAETFSCNPFLPLTLLRKEKKETKRKMIFFNDGFAICNKWVCRIRRFLSLKVFTVAEERERRATLLVREE